MSHCSIGSDVPAFSGHQQPAGARADQFTEYGVPFDRVGTRLKIGGSDNTRELADENQMLGVK